VLHAQDSYNQDMADGLAQHFSTGVVQLFPLDGTSFDQVALTDFAPDAIALFAFPVEAATVVQILASLNFGGRQLYLPPTLDDDGFLVNVLPDAVEGATGLSPYLPTYAEQPFAEAFAQRWMGEPPTGAAYFYYDAVALLALAMQEAITAGDSSFTSLGNDVVNISLSGGTIVNWNELDKGLELLREGSPVNYRGASSSIDLTADGDPTQQPMLRYWTIKGGKVSLTDQQARCLY